MFGQGGFGQNQPASSSGFFGGGGGGFGSQGMNTGGGFGNLGQTQNPQTPIFGGAGGGAQPMGGGGFGGTSGGIFGQQQQQNPSGGFGGFGGGAGGFGGNAPSHQTAGSNFSTFSQAAGNKFGQSGFGQTSSSGFGGGGTFGGGMGGGFQGGQQQQSAQVGPGYYKSVPFDQTTTTINHYFTHKQENLNEQKGATTGNFHNIRAEPKFNALSNQMLKVLDLLANMQGGQPPQSYENIGMQEFNQNSNQYIYLTKVQGGQQAPNMMGGGMGGQSGFFNQSTSGFGAGGFGAQKPAWGAGGAQQQSTPLFGGGAGGGGGLGFGQQTSSGLGQPGFNQSGFQNKPLFGGGMNQPAQTMGLGGVGGLFGQQQQNQGLGGGLNKPGGLFGQNTPTPAGGGFMGAGGTQGGGLFGQQQQTGTPGLFGQQQQQTPGLGQSTLGFGQQQQQPGQTPLFGGTQQQPQQQTSLFGGQQTTTTPSLFGGQQQQQQPAAGGSLFGGQQQQPQNLALGASGQTTGLQLGGQSSLFGAKPAGQQSSLFGGGQQQTQTPGGTSLFGGTQQQAAQPSSLFGGAQQTQQQPSSNLFGAKPLGGTTLGQPSSSLFGGQQTSLTQSQTPSLFGGGGLQTQQPAGGLFGPTQSSQNLQQQTTTSMFSLQGSTMQQPSLQYNQQQQQMVINPYLDQNKKDPYGAFQLLSRQLPFENDNDIKQVQEQIQTLKSKANQTQNPYEESLMGERLNNQTFLPLSQPLPSISEEENRDVVKKSVIQKYYQPVSQGINEPGIYNMTRGYIAQKSAEPLKQKKSFGTDSSMAQSNYQTLLSRQTSNQRDNFVMNQRDNFITPIGARQPIMATDKPVVRQKLYEDDQQLLQPAVVNPDVITITINYPEIDGHEKIENVRIHRSRDVKDIYDKVERTLLNEKLLDIETQEYMLLYKNAILGRELTLEQAGIQQNTKVVVIYKSKELPHEKVASPAKPLEKSPSLVSRQSVPQEKRPRQPKIGYEIKPSFETLQRMSFDELKRVKDFTIWNQYGSIKFEGETDLVDVDLADVVTISKKSAEVYDDTRHKKPEVGQKLNKPAFITLNEIDPLSKKTPEEKEELLKKQASNNDVSNTYNNSKQCQHISYDYLKKQWQFKVFHFTKYGLDEEGAEEEEPAQQQQEPMRVQTTTSQVLREGEKAF